MGSKSVSMGFGLVLTIGLVSGVSYAGIGDWLKQADSILNQAGSSTSAPAINLPDSRINAGLKQALTIGAERAISILGKKGGFLNDPTVRIPLPGVLESVGKGMRSFGQGKYVDQFENSVNRAAEEAIPQTLMIVKETVTNMTLEDVRGIMSGGDDAATRFLERRAGPSLQKAIKPIVAKATGKSGATAAYKGLKKKADATLGGFINTDMADLDEYVTRKTMDGLFLKLAAEEKKIRKDPVARTTDLLKQVFSN